MGKLVAITGVDGCGKTTQIQRLVEVLNNMGIACGRAKLADIPNPPESIIKEMASRYSLDFCGASNRLTFECLCMKYKIDTFIAQRKLVYSYLLLDRYLESIFGIAREYKDGGKIVRMLFADTIMPDVAILLDVDLGTAYDRMKRRDSISTNPVTPHQTLAIMNNYFKNEFNFYKLNIVNGEGEVDTVTERLLYEILRN